MDIVEYQKMYELEDRYWWWVGRRAIVGNILDKLSLGSKTAILDAGCGTGINLYLLNSYGDVVGLDFSEHAINFCRKRGLSNVIQGNAEKTRFKDSTFDVIIALDILEHVDDHMTLKEFHRILKPSGRLVLTVPAFNFLWSKHDEAMHHKRRYNKAGLKFALESNGFTLERLTYWNCFMFLPVALVRLIRRYLIKSGEIESDVKELPRFLNSLFISILRTESVLLRHWDLPFGVSLLGVARAKN